MLAKGWGHLFSVAANHLSDLIFPPVCTFCSVELTEMPENTISTARFCRSCLEAILPTYSHRCQQCGAGVSITTFRDAVDANAEQGSQDDLSAHVPTAQGSNQLSNCRFCRRGNWRFQNCISLGNYELQVREAVLRCKSGTDDALTISMAKLLAERVIESREQAQHPISLILPIPIHWRRRLGRPSVVSELIAIQLARRIRSRCHLRGLKYNRLTVKQGTLSTTDRIENVRHAISVGNPRILRGKDVLLVDDVMTSGATLNEAAKACLSGGARSVSAAVLARGVGRSLNR